MLRLLYTTHYKLFMLIMQAINEGKQIMQYTYKIFGTPYGSGNYNSTTYNGQTQTGTNTGNNGNSNGGLADTGYDIIIPVALAIALVVAGVILLVKRAKRKNKK